MLNIKRANCTQSAYSSTYGRLPNLLAALILTSVFTTQLYPQGLNHPVSGSVYLSRDNSSNKLQVLSGCR